jgi:NhaP-type Na+/H+ or K+/H+ antiporter
MVAYYWQFCLSGSIFTALAVAVTTNYFIPGFTIALGFLLGESYLHLMR